MRAATHHPEDTMPEKKAPVDKARQAADARLAAARKAVAEALQGFGTSPERAESAKEVAAWKAKADAAAKDAGPAATKAVDALCKAGDKLAAAIRQRSYDAYAKGRRVELKGQVNAGLASALLEIGKLQDPALVKLMFAEQAALKARMDKAEKVKKDLDAVDLMGDLGDEAVPALQQRLKAAAAVSAWLAGTYRKSRSAAEQVIGKVGSEPERKALLAEIEFVEAAKQQALARLDVKALEAATMPKLRELVAQAKAKAGAAAPAAAGKRAAAR
jgi:hypothetical protein